MGIKWNCLEPLTAIGIGLGACAMAPFDGGLAAGAVIGGAGLLSRIKENSAKAGLDDSKLIGRVQKKLLGQLDHWDQRGERAAAERADERMKVLLPQVMLRRDELARTAFESRDEKDRYPVIAARRVVDELARHDPMFAVAPAGASERAERAFAIDVVETALRAGMEDPDYATLLTLDIAVELAAAIRETIDAVHELNVKVERGFDALQAELVEIRNQGRGDEAKLARLSEKALRGAIARFVAFSPRSDTEEIVEAVEQFAEDYEKLETRVQALDAQDNQVRGLQQQAQEALADGDLEEARRLLREASEVRVDAATRAVRDASASMESLAEADLAALDWESAASNWKSAAAMMAPFDEKRSASISHGAGVLLYEFGEKFGQGGIEAAIESYRFALEKTDRENAPHVWAGTQNNLGGALVTLAERAPRGDSSQLLAEAKLALLAAAEIRSRDQHPDEWAMTQNNLGVALRLEGLQLHGAPGIAALEGAAEAFRGALEVRTLDRDVFDWATTQNNLGAVCRTLGVRLPGEQGAAALDDARALFTSIIDSGAREQAFTQWCKALNNLGNVLTRLGEASGGAEGVALLDQAVAYYRRSIEATPRDQSPISWALTHNNLGNALSSQGERLSGSDGLAKLKEAIDAYEAALEIYTRDALPVQWSMAQNNLAVALKNLASRVEGNERAVLLKNSITACREALTARPRQHFPIDWAISMNNLGNAMHRLAQTLGKDDPQARSSLNGAVIALRGALEVFSPSQTQFQWLSVQTNLSGCLLMLGHWTGGANGEELLRDAMAACHSVREAVQPQRMPTQWGVVSKNLALACQALSAIDTENRRTHLEDARAAATEAQAVFSPEHSAFQHASASRVLASIEKNIAELSCDDGAN